jgi:hypothetical protein
VYGKEVGSEQDTAAAGVAGPLPISETDDWSTPPRARPNLGTVRLSVRFESEAMIADSLEPVSA